MNGPFGDNQEAENTNEKYIIAVDSQGNIQKQVTGEIYVSDLKYTEKEQEATEFFTNEEGKIGVYNIITDRYKVIETTIGKDNYGYEIDDEYISWITDKDEKGNTRTATIDIERQKSYYTKPTEENPGSKYNNSITYYNQRKYIRLSGTVWEDRIDTSKQATKDYLLAIPEDKNEQDKLLANVTVRLKDKNENIIAFKDEQGNILNEVQTNQDGKYVLWDIEINKLDQYYIEFTYNGMSYESVPAKILEERGSKAEEGQARTDFNNQYSIIAKKESRDQNNQPIHNLIYDETNYNSKIHLGDNLKYGYENQKYPINETYSNFLITANTRNAYKNEKTGQAGYLDAIQDKDTIRNEATEEIGNINLGVQERKEIDLKIEKNILNNVQVTINQKIHQYDYNERYLDNLYTEDELNQMTPQVRYELEYRARSYTRALYPSDVYYGKKDPGPTLSQDEQLKIKVTYEIKLVNEKKVTAIINEMSDFYDGKYEGEKGKVSIGRQLNDKGDILETSKLTSFEIEKAKDNNSLHHIKIKDMNLKIEAEQTQSIYLQLEIKQDQIVDIVETNSKGEKEVKLSNIAEITSYSSKDENGNPYAGIDLDSQPENSDPANIATFEDDTKQAVGLKLVLQENRKIDGIVFVDNILENHDFQVSEINTGKTRQGNGRYEGEKGVAGVTVRLIEEGNENLSEPTSIWKPKGREGTEGEWVKAETKTDENGYYQFEGIIPRNYKVVYVWGDEVYKVQDYKSTIVDEQTHKDKNDENNLEWYKDEFKKQHQGIEWDERTNQEIRVSDALDNYTSRETIDKQSTIMTNQNKTGINTYRNDIQIEQPDGTYQNLITSLDANTPNFRVNVEYSTNATNAREEYELENGIIKMNGIYVEKANGHENYLKNIDFGIAERAKTALKLTKEVKRVRIVLDNGIVLSDAQIEDGKIKNNAQYAVYLPESSTKGQIKFEVDNELLQNAHLEIQYGIKIDNISEVDYKNKEYYWYGGSQKREDIAKLDTKAIIDYLDNQVSVDEEKNGLGEQVQDNEEKEKIITEQGLLENTETMRKKLLEEHNRILKIDKQISQLLEPNESHEVTLIADKLLMNTVLEEGIELGNQAEIVKVEKTWGSSLITIPGDNKGIDVDISENITIVPPTGRITNTIAYIMLTISSCAILVGGIILIKKYVLK